MSHERDVVTHAEARQILSRFNASHWNNPSEHARYSIPANPRRDDDLRLRAYIDQQEAAAAELTAELAAIRTALGTRPVGSPGHTYCHDVVTPGECEEGPLGDWNGMTLCPKHHATRILSDAERNTRELREAEIAGELVRAPTFAQAVADAAELTAARERIAELEAIRRELSDERDHFEGCHDEDGKRLRELETENARLRQALQPFAWAYAKADYVNTLASDYVRREHFSAAEAALIGGK